MKTFRFALGGELYDMKATSFHTAAYRMAKWMEKTNRIFSTLKLVEIRTILKGKIVFKR